ncbi:dienelactone hydrolase family protein [Croceibacterium aestuarii]|uniref:dienelactone hydrolase family protein n=1 Tax=Croceibacterium aestuarii TaxID=3064139 RepID=UPI00272E70C8|nr:dienelactone hydrolase family protein [Croceibacterium sp. D39]
MTRRAFAALTAMFGMMVAACATVPAGSAAAGERHVTVTTAEGAADALLFTPAKGRAPGVILFSDLGGLRPAIADLGRKLAGDGYVVLVPNAFYRSVALDGTAASTLDYPTRSKQWRGAATDAAVIEDSKAYVAYLDGVPQVDKSAKLGVVGYDIGAAYAFIAARAVPGRIGAVAAIHPLAVATARPNSPHLFVNQSKAAYYVVMGKNAFEREPGDKTDLEKAFADAGLKGTVVVAAGNHGFGVSDNPAYDAASADQAWAAMLALLRSSLK